MRAVFKLLVLLAVVAAPTVLAGNIRDVDHYEKSGKKESKDWHKYSSSKDSKDHKKDSKDHKKDSKDHKKDSKDHKKDSKDYKKRF